MKGYGLSVTPYNSNSYQFATTISNRVAKSSHWFIAAKILRAVAAVFTLPVTSAACAAAAAVFVQRNGNSSKLSMRQVGILANRAWHDPSMYSSIVLQWKRYGTSFILLAIALNILGAAIYPLQEGLLSTKTVKTPVAPTQIYDLVDIPSQLDPQNGGGLDTNNAVVYLTRESLKTASIDTSVSEIWLGAGVDCEISKAADSVLPVICDQPGSTLNGIFALHEILGSGAKDPFVAQLPSGFNTGVISQFIPRINSSAEYTSIDASQWPKNCDTQTGAFYTKYENSTTSSDCDTSYSIEACMPGDQTKSPWTSTRDRQDFSEELFLAVNLAGCLRGVSYGTTYFRLSMNTTAGYFELPNYMNGGVAGPLLDMDFSSGCGDDCEPQILNAT